MESRFLCSECKSIFISQGVKLEYISPIYGPCSKLVAVCPTCGTESDEFRNPKPVRKSSSTPAPSCGMGGCCCGGN